MRHLAALVLTGLICLVLIGCAETNTETAAQHTHRIKRNMQKDCRNIPEDWDRFWMADQPSRATKLNM